MLISKTDVPPCGWNSYDCYAGCINEEEANANLDVFIDRLKPFGFDYFCLDAAWYADGSVLLNNQLRAKGMYRPMHIDEWGRHIASPVMFPHGLKALADRCHVNGIKFGLHMMRGMPTEAFRYNTPILGTPYHARDIALPEQNCSWCKYWTAIDVHKPGAQEFLDSEVSYLADNIGVDFIKLDDATEHPEDVEAFARAIDKSHRPILLSLSPGNEMHDKLFQRYGAFANMVRITPDRWDEDAEILTALERSYNLEGLSGAHCWMDLDMIPFGGLQVNMPPSSNKSVSPLGCARQCNLSPAGKQALMTLCAIVCSPIIFGGDLPTTPPQDFEILLNSEILKCNRNGRPGIRTYYQNHTDVRKALSCKEKGTGWVAIFNTNDLDRHIFLDADALNFDTMPALTDVWGGNRPVVPNPDGTVDFYIQKRGCTFLAFHSIT